MRLKTKEIRSHQLAAPAVSHGVRPNSGARVLRKSAPAVYADIQPADLAWRVATHVPGPRRRERVGDPGIVRIDAVVPGLAGVV
jgi:hypothetical protein